MSIKTLRFISRVLCVVMLASLVLEAPLSASTPQAIRVNVGGQVVNVTPGQWVSVQQGTSVAHYNVRYVNGQPVALEMSQYMKLVFNGSSAGTAAATAGQTTGQTSAPSGTTAPSTPAPVPGADVTPATTNSGRTWDSSAHPRDPVTGRFVSQTDAPSTTGTVAEPTAAAPVGAGVADDVAAATKAPVGAGVADDVAAAQAPTTQAADGAKAGSGNWIKDELSGYGKNIKDSFNSGKESGNNFGTKTVDGVKSGASKVGDGVKATGSKIGDLLKGAKDRIARIFRRDPAPTPAKGDSGQSGQSGDPDGAGQSGQSGDPDGAGQSGQSGQSEQGAETKGGSDQSGQTGQSGDPDGAGQTGQTGQSGQSGQGGQSGQSGQAGEGKPGFWDKTKGSLQKGYTAGKAMTNQGFANVKDSLKSGFSPKNLLLTAGITVGVDLANQIMKGEKPSLGKALRIVTTAEFAGGVVGSVGGAAAGSFFVPFLSAIPVVGGVLGALAPTFGSIIGGSMGAYLAGDLKNGKFSIKAAFKQLDWVGITGQAVGSTLGATLGAALGPVGMIVGGMVGGWLGNKAAHWIAGLFGKGNSGNNGIGYPGLGQPVGATPYDQGIPITGDVGFGGGDAGVAGGIEIPVAGDQTAQVSVSADQNMGNYGSEVQLAYAKYQELYRLYNELLNQGRQEDAMKVADEMNKAKAEFDRLRASSGQ